MPYHESFQPPKLRIFISSPSDASAERQRAKEVISKLSGQSFDGQRYELEALLWEEATPAVVGSIPQAALDYYVSRAADVDIYIAIFRQRIGSSVVRNGCRYESGTLYEFRDANVARMMSGKPVMLLYRSRRDLSPPQDTEAALQLQKVEAFFSRSLICDGDPLAFDGFTGEFEHINAFAERLERDLKAVIPKIGSKKGGRFSDLIDGVAKFLKEFEQVSPDERLPVIPIKRSYTRIAQKSDLYGNLGMRASSQINENLLDFFRANDWRLLIIGPEGAGKTFEMWQLMQLLLYRARMQPTDVEIHVPVYFNLASWAAEYQRKRNAASLPLDNWFVDELVRRYSLSRNVARDLVGDREIIFCVDGLDELVARPNRYLSHESDYAVEDDAATLALRNACVRAVNETIKQSPKPRLILCCRSEVLSVLDTMPELGQPIYVDPLDDVQVISEMARWIGLDALREAIRESEFLRAQARNPLQLRLMQRAYASEESHLIQDETDSRQTEQWRLIATSNKRTILADAEVGSSGIDDGIEKWCHKLVAKYVERCIPITTLSNRSERSVVRPYNRTTAIRYLSWMSSHLPKDFLIEDFQPSLLSNVVRYRQYRWSSVALMTIILALCGAIPPALGTAIEWGQTHSSGEAISEAVSLGLIITGTVVALGAPALMTSNWIAFGLCLGLAFGLARGASVTFSAPEATTGSGIWNGLKAAAITLPCATIVFLLFGLQTVERVRRLRRPGQPGSVDIVPLENMNWTWYDTETKRGGWIGLVVGPFVGLALLATGFGPARGIAFAVIVTIIVVLFAGAGGTGLRVSLSPNQGIRRSLQHAVIMAAVLTAAAVFACAISYGIGFGVEQGVVNAVHAGVVAFSFLMFGGIPVIRHVCLGHQLHKEGGLPTWWCLPPWRATVAFLDGMVDCQILRRSAGGYAFRHGILREYFQSLFHNSADPST